MDTLMVYVVSGELRSGTSMMMAALEAGGLTARFDPSRQERLPVVNGYRPHKTGAYEIPLDYDRQTFIEEYDGALVKVFAFGLSLLPAGPVGTYQVVFVRRAPEEIHASLRAVGLGPDYQDPHRHQHVLDEMIANARARPDMTLDVLEYAMVVTQPHQAFTSLRDWGWPIDPVAAASVVDPAWYRHRRDSPWLLSPAMSA